MRGCFSNYLLEKKPVVQELIEQLKLHFDFASVLATDVKSEMVRMDYHTSRINPTGVTECGFVIKVHKNGCLYEYSLNDFGQEDIPTIVDKLIQLYKDTIGIDLLGVKKYEQESLTKDFVRKNEGKEYTTKELLDFLKGQKEDVQKKYNQIINCNMSVEQIEYSKMYISFNRTLTQYYTWTGAMTYAMSRDDNNMKYAYSGYGDDSTERVLASFSDHLNETCVLAIALLKASLPVPGVYDVITDPSITGLIAHEAFGHGVEMDQFVKDRALAKEYMNKVVASPLITMHDGANSCLSAASYFFDDDGDLARDTIIIDKGVLVSGINDATSAVELGVKPTGNSRRESYKTKAFTRMTNTFFDKGTSSLQDMIQSIKKGYYIGITNNGMEDPKNWGIQCTALYGKEIVDGKFTGNIISPVVMSGYVLDLLKSITAVANDGLIEGSGSCGKGYKNWVRVATGGAYLKAKVKIG